MPYNYFSNQPLNLFSNDTAEKIHGYVLQLCGKTGVKVESTEALELLSDYGVKCDFEKSRIYPSQDNIARALKTVSREYELYLRKGDCNECYQVNSSNSFTISGAAAIKIRKGDTYVDTNREDLIAMTLLHERLKNIHVLMNLVEPFDVKTEELYPLMAADLFSYSTKPLLLQAMSKSDLEKIIEMASLFVGGRDELRKKPVFSTGSNAEEPLCIPSHAAEILIEAPRNGIPASLGSYLMPGSSAPLNIMAAIIQRTATVLSGLLITQASEEGSAYDFEASSGFCDLRNGDVLTMSPDVMQLNLGAIQMARYYKLNAKSIAATEAKQPDEQAAVERCFSLGMSLMAGATFVFGATSEMCGMELADPVQSVIDNEIAGYLFEFIKEPCFDSVEESLKAIDEVVNGEKGANFLSHPSTFDQCKNFKFGYELFTSGMLSRWLDKKDKSLIDKAEAVVEDRLKERSAIHPKGLVDELYKIAKST